MGPSGNDGQELGDFGAGIPITFKQRLRPALGYRLPKAPSLMIVFDYKRRTQKRHGNGIIEQFYCHECLSITDGNLSATPMVYVCNDRFVTNPEKSVNGQPHRCMYVDVGTTLGKSRFYELKFELRFAPAKPWEKVVEEELVKIAARTDLNDDEKMNMRVAFLKKKPHKRKSEKVDEEQSQTQINSRPVRENETETQEGTSNGPDMKRCKEEGVDADGLQNAGDNSIDNSTQRGISDGYIAIPSTSQSTLLNKELENTPFDAFISNALLSEFGRGIPVVLKPNFRPALAYRLRGAPGLAVTYSYGFTSKRRKYHGKPVDRYYCFECSRRKRKCPGNLYPTPASAIVVDGLFLTDPENPPNTTHFCTFMNLGEILGKSRFAELCEEMKNSSRSWKEVIVEEVTKVDRRTDLTEEDKCGMRKVLLCKSSIRIAESEDWLNESETRPSVSLDVVKLEPIDEEMLQVKDTHAADTENAKDPEGIVQPISEKLLEALNAVTPTVRRSHMIIRALEKFDIFWKDLVAEICRKLEEMPLAAQEKMLFSVRVMVANLENTFSLDRLREISGKTWPAAIVQEVDAKAVVEQTKKLDQIVFELNTYTNRNFRCPLCGNYFTQKSSVGRHLQRVHFATPEKIEGELGISMNAPHPDECNADVGNVAESEVQESSKSEENLKADSVTDDSGNSGEMVVENIAKDQKRVNFLEFEATLTKALEDVKPVQNRSHLLLRIMEKLNVTRRHMVERIAEALIAVPSIFRDEALAQILDMFASKGVKGDQELL